MNFKLTKRKKTIIAKTFRIIFLVVFYCLAFALFTAFFFVTGLYVKYSHDFDSIKAKSNSTQLILYDRNGEEIFKGYGSAEPDRVELNNIPDVVKKATIAAEDVDFYNHGPIDLKGIARAAYINWQNSEAVGMDKVREMFTEGSYTQGGSTITQQLVKNLYLTNERSFNRKIKEVIFSYNLENKYSKDEILELYINEIFYGEQALGINNAAKVYFNKNLDQLNLAEASMLAGLPAAPSLYTPIGDYQAGKKRQEYVLQEMIAAEMITIEEAKKAIEEPLLFYGEREIIDKYPYFSQYVKEELVKTVGEIEDKGYRVYTTLDSNKQRIAQERGKYELSKLVSRGASNASIVIADPVNNEILALIGGIDWNVSKVNVATSERQPGSSFKPIVYATALENGYTAATILVDKSVNFGGIPPYMPKNYSGGYSGYLTVRNALARSLNVPAVEMTKLVTKEKVIDMAHDLGISTINNDPESYGLSIGLGSAEVKLLDMVEAYSVFADKGKRSSQTSIIKIVDKYGEALERPDRVKEQVISEETAFIISSILSDNKARSATFGTRSPLLTKKTTAVKTGTTDSYADSWTVGYSPNLVVGVWMGNNDRKPMKRVSGVEGAAYIWNGVIEECLLDYPETKFSEPAKIKKAYINQYTGAYASHQGSPNVLEYFKEGTIPGTKVDLSYLRQF